MSKLINDRKKIRNFSIIAHIDHGKSTLADRMLELTHTVSKREMKDQMLDQMDLERERGITIKAQAVRIEYKAVDGEVYELNLIDTPGHVDFTYEVSRSLAACEGALLIVDASQGVEAQTVANTYLALENDLEIIPVINKIDLPSADPKRVEHEIEEGLGIPADGSVLVSAKTGEGVEDVLEAIIKFVPPPKGDEAGPLKALVFDSKYDSYRGVIAFIRVFDGELQKGNEIVSMATGIRSSVEEVGIFSPKMIPVDKLGSGQVGYLITGIKDVGDVKVGDTITDDKNRAKEALVGYKEAKSMVFCGLYPLDGGKYSDLRDALEKLKLNDPAISFEPETSSALGFGFRCGFLGLLHLEIIKERLQREYGVELLATAPSVAYRVIFNDETIKIIKNPSEFPEPNTYLGIEEPFIEAKIFTPPEYVGAIMDLCQTRRGNLGGVQYLSENRVQINYELPLGEIVMDFYDQLKSRTKGYASLDYDYSGYQNTQLVKLEILLGGDAVDAFSSIMPKEKAYERGKYMAEKLREIIPRQMFEVAIQAAIGGRIIARETVKAKRKDVTSKCYGGDISRKRKLLERQKEGKKRMKQVGKVTIPPDAFMTVLKVED